jgi:hypothetical protein
MGRSKGTAFGQEEVAGVFRLPEGKKIYPEHNFDKTNMAKGEKLSLEGPQVLHGSTSIILRLATQTHFR